MTVNQPASEFDVGSLRDPAELMQPERLAALKQTRLSFARLLVEKMRREEWDVYVDRADIDEHGEGRVVYNIETPSRQFAFGVFSHSTEGENTDRIIADNWDMWGFLCEGEATPELMDHQYEELPHVREGRATTDILIWTRANRSSRFFGHVVDSLAEGHQPDIEFLARGGYLMRSSGYYGNGLNGTKEFRALDEDHPLKKPYAAQMLSVWLLRIFSYDLAEYMAEARNPDAPTLDEDIKRYLGTGNSSGIGIIHYVINHPQLIDTWLRTREIALARAKSIEPSREDIGRFRRLAEEAERWFSEDDCDTAEFFLDKDVIARGIDQLVNQVETLQNDPADRPLWTRLCEWAETNLEPETQEVLHSLLVDVHPEVCEGLRDSLVVSEKTDVVPEMELERLTSLVRDSYEWALDIDMDAPGATRYFWYRSINSEEPRLGIRGEHDYEEYGFPIDIARQLQDLVADLVSTSSTTVAEFLVEHPEHRSIIQRVQAVHDLPYAEVRANPLDGDFIPLSLISCLKAIWGIQRAHPKSKGWVRGTFFQGAPLPEDLHADTDPYWLYPTRPEQTSAWRDEA